ncbi:MAG: peptide deformylase [Firmicutes bacterium]|nr:peptide deformylase [Bacillota bacterium]
MAIRNVLKNNEPPLREVCREVTAFDERLWSLLNDLRDTMLFEDGVGLAAPQVGVLKRVAVLKSLDGVEYFELINPVIEKTEGEQIVSEGCLSIPNAHGKVKRPSEIIVSYFDREGVRRQVEVKDFFAVIFCHEIDHLDGILYTDRMVAAAD